MLVTQKAVIKAKLMNKRLLGCGMGIKIKSHYLMEMGIQLYKMKSSGDGWW